MYVFMGKALVEEQVVIAVAVSLNGHHKISLQLWCPLLSNMAFQRNNYVVDFLNLQPICAFADSFRKQLFLAELVMLGILFLPDANAKSLLLLLSMMVM